MPPFSVHPRRNPPLTHSRPLPKIVLKPTQLRHPLYLEFSSTVLILATSLVLFSSYRWPLPHFLCPQLTVVILHVWRRECGKVSGHLPIRPITPSRTSGRGLNALWQPDPSRSFSLLFYRRPQSFPRFLGSSDDTYVFPHVSPTRYRSLPTPFRTSVPSSSGDRPPRKHFFNDKNLPRPHPSLFPVRLLWILPFKSF